MEKMIHIWRGRGVTVRLTAWFLAIIMMFSVVPFWSAPTAEAATSAVTKVPTAKSGLVYTGSEQKLISSGSVASGTMRYAAWTSEPDASELENSAMWSTSIPTGTDAGTYHVYYKVTGTSSGYEDVEPVEIAEVQIARKSLGNYSTETDGSDISVTLDGNSESELTLDGKTMVVSNYVYTGSGITPKVSVKHGDITLDEENGDYYAEITSEDEINGEITDKSQLYKIEIRTTSPNYTGVIIRYWRIVPRKLNYKAHNYEGTYDGNGHAMTFEELPDGAKVYFGESEEELADNISKENTTVPEYTDVGEHEVYYRVVTDPTYMADEVHLGTITINRKAITVSPKDETKVYGDTKDLSSFGYKVSDATPLCGEDTLSGWKVTCDGADKSAAVKEYEISVSDIQANDFNKANKNYKITVSGTATLTVTKRPVTVKAKDISKEYGLEFDASTYGIEVTDGAGDSVISSGNIRGVTYECLDADSVPMTEEQMKEQNVGKYTIRISVNEDSNPNYAITPVEGTLTVVARDLQKYAGEIKILYNGLEDSVFPYSQNLINPNPSLLDTGLGVMIDEADYQLTGAVKAAELGLHKITIRGKRNYTGTLYGNWEIAAIQNEEVPYSGEPQSPKVTLSEGATVKYSPTTDDVATEDIKNLQYTLDRAPSFTKVGTYYVYAQVTQSEELYGGSVYNYKCTFTITPKEVKLAAVNKQKTYGASDPVLEYKVVEKEITSEEEAQTAPSALGSGDKLTGVQLVRTKSEDVGNSDGEDVGIYAIQVLEVPENFSQLSAVNKNYKIVGYLDGSLTIKKAVQQAQSDTVELLSQDHAAKTYDIQDKVINILETSTATSREEENLDFKNISYEIGEVAGDDIFASAPQVDANGIISYQLKDGASAEKEATIPVTVSSKNYEDFVFILTVSTKKNEGKISFKDDFSYSKTYDGSPVELSEGDAYTLEGTTGEVSVSYCEMTDEFPAGTEEYTAGTPKDAGRYMIKLVKAESSDFTEATACHEYTILKKAITIDLSSAAKDKTYDGEETAEFEDVIVSDAVTGVAGETFTIGNLSGVFQDETEGTDTTLAAKDVKLNESGEPVSKRVSVNTTQEAQNPEEPEGKLVVTPGTNTNRANYEIAYKTDNITATIVPYTITPVLAAKDKQYDGTDEAEVEVAFEEGLVGDEKIIVNGFHGTFEGKDVRFDTQGNPAPQSVTASKDTVVIIAGAGTKLDNYKFSTAPDTLDASAVLTATIRRREVAVTYNDVAEKVYDGSDEIELVGNIDTGIVENEEKGTVNEGIVVRNVKGTFVDEKDDGGNILLAGKDVKLDENGEAVAKTVAIDQSEASVEALQGTEIRNYDVTFPETDEVTASARIMPKELTVSYKTENKVYDGTTQAAVSGTAIGVGEDTFAISGLTGEFAGKDVAETIPVTVDSSHAAVIPKEGVRKENYTFAYPEKDDIGADITKCEISVAPVAGTKKYGEADPELNYEITSGSLVNGDRLTGITVTRAEGTDVGNYAMTVVSDNTKDTNYAITAVNIPTVNFTIVQADGPDGPTGLIAHKATSNMSSNGSIDGVDSTMEYSVNGGARWREIGEGETAITGLKAGEVLVRIKETMNVKVGSSVTVTIGVKGSQEAPTGLTAQKATSETAADGVVLGVTDEMEYSTDNGVNWTAVGEGKTEITGLEAGTVSVRYASTEDFNAGEIVRISVGNLQEDRDEAIREIERTLTTYSVTLNTLKQLSDDERSSYKSNIAAVKDDAKERIAQSTTVEDVTEKKTEALEKMATLLNAAKEVNLSNAKAKAAAAIEQAAADANAAVALMDMYTEEEKAVHIYDIDSMGIAAKRTFADETDVTKADDIADTTETVKSIQDIARTAASEAINRAIQKAQTEVNNLSNLSTTELLEALEKIAAEKKEFASEVSPGDAVVAMNEALDKISGYVAAAKAKNTLNLENAKKAANADIVKAQTLAEQTIETLLNLSTEEKEYYTNEIDVRSETGIVKVNRATTIDSITASDGLKNEALEAIAEVVSQAKEKNVTNLADVREAAIAEIEAAATAAVEEIGEDNLKNISAERSGFEEDIEKYKEKVIKVINGMTSAESILEENGPLAMAKSYIQGVIDAAKVKNEEKLAAAKEQAVAFLAAAKASADETIDGLEGLSDEEKDGFKSAVTEAQKEGKDRVYAATLVAAITAKDGLRDKAVEAIEDVVTEAKVSNLKNEKIAMLEEITELVEDAIAEIDEFEYLSEDKRDEAKAVIKAIFAEVDMAINGETEVSDEALGRVEAQGEKKERIRDILSEAANENFANLKGRMKRSIDDAVEAVQEDIEAMKSLTDEQREKATETINDAAAKAKAQVDSVTEPVAANLQKVVETASDAISVIFDTKDSAELLNSENAKAEREKEEEENVPDTREEDKKESSDKTAGEKTTEENPAGEDTTVRKKVNSLSMNSRLKVSQTGKKIKVSWGRVSGADGYKVFVQYCGKKYGKAAKTISSNTKTSAKITKINKKKLNLKKNYKVYVSAYKNENGKKVRVGKTIEAHIVGKNNTKYSNPKQIKLSRKNLRISAGRKFRISAKVVLKDKTKKHLSNAHARKLRFESTDTNVATVTKNGTIKAVASGICQIYVYARNGYTKKVTVRVK